MQVDAFSTIARISSIRKPQLEAVCLLHPFQVRPVDTVPPHTLVGKMTNTFRKARTRKEIDQTSHKNRSEYQTSEYRPMRASLGRVNDGNRPY